MTEPKHCEKMYLISESEIQQWQTVTKMSPTCQEIRERVRSRPAPGDVLDKLEKWLEGQISKAQKNVDGGDPSLFDLSCRVPFEDVKKKIAALRKAGEQG